MGAVSWLTVSDKVMAPCVVVLLNTTKSGFAKSYYPLAYIQLWLQGCQVEKWADFFSVFHDMPQNYKLCRKGVHKNITLFSVLSLFIWCYKTQNVSLKVIAA